MDWRIYFLVIPVVNGARALTCLQCKGVSQPRHCTIVDECYPGEVCGVEKVRNTLGHTVYNVGCMIQSKCQNNSITHQGIRNGECLDCCYSDLCNAQGCGEPGYPQTRGPICYNCPLHTSLDTCNAITFCEPGDLCKFSVFKEFGDTVYTGECSSTHECKHDNTQGSVIVGRDVTNLQEKSGPLLPQRSLIENVCTGCCDTDLCNKGCNGPKLVTEMTDCLDIFNHGGNKVDGIYTIRTWKTYQKIRVYCDMTTAAGGWTVIQHRFDKSVDFFRNFSEYENGFGDLTSEFWLGLKYIQEIESQSTTHLRIDVETDDGTAAFETFNMFKLSPRPAYTLYLGDTISSHRLSGRNVFASWSNGSGFSTFDHDVDSYPGNCALKYKGGWWYDLCLGADLNGRIIYYHGFITGALKSSKMMIKRN